MDSWFYPDGGEEVEETLLGEGGGQQGYCTAGGEGEQRVGSLGGLVLYSGIIVVF